MILEFRFNSISNNGVLENLLHIILHKIICKYPVEGIINTQKENVFLYAKGEEESLKSFSDMLSKYLPFSLFYTFQEVKVVENLPPPTPLANCLIHIPFIQTTLEKVLDKNSEVYYNPFVEVGFGKSLEKTPPLEFMKDNSYKKTMQHVAKLVHDGQSIRLNTDNGIKRLIKLTDNSREVLKNKNFIVLPTDFSVVSKMFIAQPNELQALASLEKPIINLRMNLIYQNRNFSPSSWVDVKLGDTLLLFLLSRELFELGVEFAALIEDDELTDINLTHHQNFKHQELKINVLENSAVSILGTNDVLNPKPLPEFELKSHERFTSILYEHGLFSKKSVCFYLSKKYDDEVMVYSEKTGLVGLIGIELPTSIAQVIELIENADEGGATLIANYKKEFKDIFEKASKIVIPTHMPKNFYTLLGIAGVFFGFGESIGEASRKLLYHAKNSAAPKGPRIDVKMKNEKFPDTVDIVRFIRSGLSFRLAGLDDELLSFGYLESIAYFVSDCADIIAKEFDITHVGLCGELFEFKRALETAAKNIQPNFQVRINKIYPLDA